MTLLKVAIQVINGELYKKLLINQGNNATKEATK